MSKIEEKLNLENKKLATTRTRGLAYVIDDLIISLLMVAIFWDNIANATSIEESIFFINQAFSEMITLKVIYHTFFVWKYGQSVGKMAMKIRVIEINSLDNPTLLTALIRASVRVVSELFFYIGFLLAFFDINRQTLHDKMAKTLVIDV